MFKTISHRNYHNDLSSKEVSRCVITILNLVYACDGFISGGFPRLLLNHYQGDLKTREEAMVSYLTYKSGDIDIWFPSEVMLKEFWKAMHRFDFRSVFKERSPLGTATNLIVKPNSPEEIKIKIQVMTNMWGSPEEIMSGFDIVNAMVTLTQDGFIYDERCEALERDKTLEIDEWLSPHTIKRARKYLLRGLDKMTPKAASGLVKYSVDLMQELDKHSFIDSSGMVAPLTKNKVLVHVSSFVKHLSNEDILLISALGGLPTWTGEETGYMCLADHLQKRAGWVG